MTLSPVMEGFGYGGKLRTRLMGVINIWIAEQVNGLALERALDPVGLLVQLLTFPRNENKRKKNNAY